MAWWQKKLLRYALSRTGFLDDNALDPDNLDITLGKKNVVELKDVGLNIKRITKLAQLPPSLRIETARILSLRLTVPADIYQSSIVVEVDGVELSLRLEETENVGPTEGKDGGGPPVAARNPQHRKVHRRLESPPPYGAGPWSDLEEAHIPTTEELAKSFLLEEPAQERRQLEASVAATSINLEESIVSESIDGSDIGTGAAIGLPGFLAGFLQGIVDRLQVSVKNVEAKLETEVFGDGQQTTPVTLQLHVGGAELSSVGPSNESGDSGDQEHPGQRQIKLQDLSLNLLSNVDIFTELSELPSRNSPPESRQHSQSPATMRGSESSPSYSPSPRPSTSSTHQSFGSARSGSGTHSSQKSPDLMRASIMTADADRFADAGENIFHAPQIGHSELDIRPGDDNISWGSRRSQSNTLEEDLWKSMAPEDDLPDSLLLERASTPRAHSSRGGSPSATRTRRDVSPYARSMEAPGSWPRLDESPQRYRSHQSPGSWPAPDQSQHSMIQPMTPSPAPPFDNGTDNKRTALEAKTTDGEGFHTPPEPSNFGVDDLTISRVFSHEEAESMYMSAMAQSSSMHVPGGWNTTSSQTESQEPPRNRNQGFSQLFGSKARDIDDDLAYGERPYHTPSGNVTPRPRSPGPPTLPPLTPHQKDLRASRKLLYIDAIFVWLPGTSEIPEQDEPVHPKPTASGYNFASNNMPGAFSAYSEMSASRRKLTKYAGEESDGATWTTYETSRTADNLSPLDIRIGIVKSQIDLPCGRLLYRLLSKAMPILRVSKSSTPEQNRQKTSNDENTATLSLSIQAVLIAFKESANGPLDAESSLEATAENLVTLHLRTVDLATATSKVDLRVSSFRMFIGESCLLSFSRSRDLKSSAIVSDQTPDIALVQVNRKAASRRRIIEIDLKALPLDILLDLPVVDQTFESFGGLSGILEVGNSILSESGSASSPLSIPKPAKGVRFEGDPLDRGRDLEIEIKARVGALCATLQGSACYVQLRTTTIHAFYRDLGVLTSIDQVLLTGPHLFAGTEIATSIDLSTLHLQYLFSPEDNDLERLLLILTPSKDKYDNDDDILLDTLMRQRRKGGLVRVSLSDAKVKVNDWTSLSYLTTLGDELGKLSAVAKYLPEDERPGLLTMIHIQGCSARLPVNECVWNIYVGMSNIYCAHVGLPALLALSVEDVNASQGRKVDLLHPLMQLSASEDLPMLMARMLGDDVEPTVKVKLFNVCVEYSVPLILDLTGLDKEADTEAVVTELARSVADIALPRHESNPNPGHASNASESAVKRMNVDLQIHDSAIGLNPQKLSSKALLVLTDAHFSSVVPVEDTLAAALELRKVGFFIADKVLDDSYDLPTSTRTSPNNTATKPKVAIALAKRGFVSVGSIMAGKISVRVEEAVKGEAKSVNVDVKNELLLLETCADSTQTLIATLNGLTPPTPPSKQPKYLTEPMTIEDMMASFTGDAYAKPERPPDTLFDAEEDDPDMTFDIQNIDDVLLSESQSVYGPISGILEGVDKPEDDDASDGFPETAESLLEEDPFEMPSSPSDAHLSDAALIRELKKQCKPTLQDVSVDLCLYEIEDLGFDALGGNQTALGTQYRFSTPAVGRRRMKFGNKHRDLPFKLKLRDLHIIWNIFDGYDWQRTRDGITEAVEEVETRAEERKTRRLQSQNQREDDESVIGDFLFNSIYIGVPKNHDVQDLRRQINRNIDDLVSETESMPVSGISRPTAYSTSGRPTRQHQRRRLKLERSKTHKIAFELKGVSADILVFPPDSMDVVSSVDVRVRDCEIFDNVPTSTWRKFLTNLNNDPGSREMSKPMIHIELFNVRTLENYAASEIVMHVTLLPLRLHVDQDALDFITRFFEFNDRNATPPDSVSEQPFIQRLEVDTVDMCLDYKPKKVDYAGLRSGHTTEFMNFIILDAANIRLKHAIVYGIKGFEPLHKTLNDIWMPDIKRNQLPTVLAGLAPVRSLVNIGTGVLDVIAIPVREYQKDGRIVRSIQKGAFQFGKTTASELARLGAKVAMGTQNLLQGAEGFLTPTSTSPGRPSPGRRPSSDQGWHDVGSEEDDHEAHAISAYSNQPLGVLSGLRSARRYLEHDLLTARDALIAVQGEVLESTSPGSAAAAVVRHAPTVILRPIIGTSRAVGTALLGVGNQIDRENLRKVDDKYKRR